MQAPLLINPDNHFHLPNLPFHLGTQISRVNEVEAFHVVCFSERMLLALMLYDFCQMGWNESKSRALGEVIMDNRLNTPVIRICWGTTAITYLPVGDRYLNGSRVGSGMTPLHNQLYWLS